MQNFIGREREIERLRELEAEVERGESPILLILGEEGVGKTALMKRFVDELGERASPVYIDLAKLNLSPDFFCLHLLGNVFKNLSEEKEQDMSLYFNLSFQQKVVQEMADSEIEARWEKFYQSLEEANWKDLFPETFIFLETLARRLDLRLILFLDNFSELLGLANYQLEPFSLFKEEASKTKRIGWVLASDRKRVLSGMFETLFLDYLEEREARKLILSLLSSHSFDEGALERIYQLTEGFPILVVFLAKELESRERISPFSVDEAFFLSFTEGAIYRYCQSRLVQKIAEARGEGLLRLTLANLAKRGEATLSEISEDIRRKTGVTRNLLLRLMDVDLVEQKEKKYYIPSRILVWWMRMYYYGILPELPELEVKLEESDEIADLLSSFSGQKMDGSLFGLKEEILLPTFDRVKVVKRGKITEIEAVAEDLLWLVYYSEDPEPVSEEQIEGMISEVKKRGCKGWFISKQGFTYEATLKAEELLMLSIDEDIKAIKECIVNS